MIYKPAPRQQTPKIILQLDSPLTQFQNQFEDVDSPTPRDRIGNGNNSPMTIHAPGPQVAAKNEMLKQMKAIMAETAELLC